jgi:hypothetical protein
LKKWLFGISFSLMVLTGVAYAADINNTIHQWFDNRPYNITSTPDGPIAISDISQQELQKAANVSSQMDPTKRDKQIEQSPFKKMPEYFSTSVKGLEPGSYKTFVEQLTYEHLGKKEELFVRVIDTNKGQRYVFNEPGSPGKKISTSKNGKYAAFYNKPFIYGLDTNSLTIERVVSSEVGEYNLQQLNEKLDNLGFTGVWYWASIPFVSPDGRYVLYPSNRHSALEAITNQDKEFIEGALADLWVYDRQNNKHFLLINDTPVLKGWVSEKKFVAHSFGPMKLVSVEDGSHVEIPDTDTETSYITSNLNSFFILKGRNNIVKINIESLTQDSLKTDGRVPSRSDYKLSPSGKYLTLLEMIGEDQTTVSIIDTDTLKKVKSEKIPPEYSFRGFGGWLNNNEVVVNIMKKGSPQDLEEKSFIFSVEGGQGK